VRQLDARGILKGRVLYNAQLRDYRALVSARLLAAELPPRVGADRGLSEQARAKLTGFMDTATREWVEEVLADNAAMYLHIDQFVDLSRGAGAVSTYAAAAQKNIYTPKSAQNMRNLGRIWAETYTVRHSPAPPGAFESGLI